jgi:cellulose biosynthesis protein BcsQ
MIPLVVYSESGGTYKTTFTANLAVAFERLGLDVLVFDFDAQTGNFTSLFECDENSDNPGADNIVRHILEQPKGDFQDLIVTTDEGFDLVPAHDMLSNFTDNLQKKIQMEASMGDIDPTVYPDHELFYDLLWEREELNKHYDVILLDPNARAEKLLYQSIFALRTLVSPVEPTGKGRMSVEGLEEITMNMSEQFDIDVGMAALIPTNVGQTKTNRQLVEELASVNPAPVTIKKRKALMNEMWDARGSAFKVVEERWDKPTGESEPISGSRDLKEREVRTLCKLYNVAHFIATEPFDETVQSSVELDVEDEGTFRYECSDDPASVSMSEMRVEQ